jgi:hypothetical protein
VDGFCEHDSEPTGSIKGRGIYRIQGFSHGAREHHGAVLVLHSAL